MDLEETKTILGLITTAYPKYYANVTNEQVAQTIALWYELLQDDDFEQTRTAALKLISTNIFPPTIAEVRATISETTQGRILDAGEAWGMVINVIRNYGYMKELEALNTLPELIARAVKYIGYQTLCCSEDHMADRAHFFRIYEGIAEREKKENQIPLAIKQAISLQLENNKKQKNKSLQLQDKNEQIIHFPAPKSQRRVEFDYMGKACIIEDETEQSEFSLPNQVKDILLKIKQDVDGEINNG